jgi:tRNA (adenine22-N1)-methyltransferase
MKDNRIDFIINQIQTKSIVVDVGSDHAKLAIKLLKTKKAIHVYNIELNRAPYLITINNLKKNGLLNQTTNLLGNGLQMDEINEPIDYCVISGMGSNNIIDILQHKSKKIHIKTFIFLPNNYPNILRKYLKEQNYKVRYEDVIKEGKYYYSLMVVSKKQGLMIKNKYQTYFGPYNLKYPTLTFQQMYQQRVDYIQNNKLHLHNQLINQELNLLKEQKYENY